MAEPKEKSLSEIKAEILKCLKELGVEVEKIILFGSRARGDSSSSSDYDFLIITTQTFPIKEKMAIAQKLSQSLARLLISTDIIIKSRPEVERLKQEIGTVVREALKEGVEI